jgi:hypothetical protein
MTFILFISEPIRTSILFISEPINK